MSAEAGGPRVYISTAYDATLSAIEAKLPEIDDCDGEMSTLVTNFAAASADWTLISELRDNVTIKFIEETEDIQFLYKLCPTYDVETVRGIQEISFTYNERDVDGLNTLVSSCSCTETRTTWARWLYSRRSRLPVSSTCRWVTR